MTNDYKVLNRIINQNKKTIISFQFFKHKIEISSINFKPISAKEEEDFHRLLAMTELTIGQAKRFAAVLNDQLASLDGTVFEIGLFITFCLIEHCYNYGQ